MMEQQLYFAPVYLAEALTVGLFFESLFSAKRSALGRWSTLFVCYGAAWLLFSLDTVQINVFVFAAGTALSLYIGYRVSIRKTFFYAVLLSALMLGTEYLSMIFLSFFLGDFSAYQNQITTLILLSVLSKLFFFLGTRLYVYLTRKEERSTMPNVVFLLLIASSLATIFVITTLIDLSLTRNSLSRKEEFGIMGSAIILCLSNILVFAAYRYIHKIHAQYTNLMLQQQKEENDRSYYESLREQFDRQRMMIHDIRHHLAAIKEMTAGDQGSAATQYITEMEGLPEFQRRSVYCSEPVLNALLMHYNDLSKQQNITFSADIRKDSVEQLNWVDLTTLLGNLLENAVESANDSENAFVDVVLDCREPSNALVLSIENSCLTTPKYNSHGTMISTKKTTSPHGIGLQSVKRVVEKYSGDIQSSYNSDTNSYHTVVVIPND